MGTVDDRDERQQTLLHDYDFKNKQTDGYNLVCRLADDHEP